jgi:phage-related protein
VTKRRWRYYTSSTGRSPVREFIGDLSPTQVAAVFAAMQAVATDGLELARHLSGDIYEVRISTGGQAFRVLFATEGQRSQILLALEASEKKTAKTPPRLIRLADTRLADWRSRARPRSLP